MILPKWLFFWFSKCHFKDYYELFNFNIFAKNTTTYLKNTNYGLG